MSACQHERTWSRPAPARLLWFMMNGEAGDPRTQIRCVRLPLYDEEVCKACGAVRDRKGVWGDPASVPVLDPPTL